MPTASFQKTVLSNGLRVLTAPMAETRSVSVSVYVGAGSRYEPPEQAGLSHFVEHLCFKGTARWRTAQELSRVIDSVGGVMNAATDRELTVFYCKVTHPHFRLALEVLAELVRRPLFSAKEVERERSVIIEELAGVADSPAQLVDVLVDETLWPGQPLGRDVAGSVETVKGLTRKAALQYLARQYVPNNAVISIAGAMSHGEAVEAAATVFDGWQAGSPANWYAAVDGQNAPRVSLRRRPTEQAHMVLAARGLPLQHPDRFASSLLSVILGEGMSSRLVMELRERRGICYDVHTYVSQFQDTGAFAAYVGVEPGKAAEALGALLGELSRVREANVGDGELVRAKALVTARLLLRMEDSRAVSDWLGGQELLTGQVREVDDVLAHLDKVTPSDVQRVARTLFVSERLNLAIVGPFKSQARFLPVLRT